MLRIKELSAAKYQANQKGHTVYVIAYGLNEKNRYEVKLEEIKPTEEMAEAIFPPQFRLTRTLLGGRVLDVETRFAVYSSFISPHRIETVTVYDTDGSQPVQVEQTPGFDINAEIKNLRKRSIQYDKLSLNLSDAVQEYDEVGVNSSVVNTSRVSIAPLFVPSGGGAPEAVIFIRCDENATFENIPGVHVNSEKGTIRTAKVSLDAIETLSNKEDVHQLAASVKMSPLNDIAAARTQLNNFRHSNNQNLTGKGIIIGIVDSGIDSSHPSFDSRILSIWDQEIKGRGWGAKNYGKVLTGALLAASEDSSGHGTHVAGIAAGRHARFGGVAPDAHLIIVKTDFNNAHIGDGIEYIFAEADRLDMPAVVNLSLGNHINAHDGTDCLSELVDINSGAGKIVVAAAGNEGNIDIHARASIIPGESAEVEFMVSDDQIPPIVIFSGWYEGDGNCEISVRMPNGSVPLPPQGLISQGEATHHHLIENMFISLSTPATLSPRNRAHRFQVKLQSSLVGQIQPGKWQIIINNVGNTDVKVDIWSITPDGFPEVEFLNPFKQDDMKIGSPGSAGSAITVGSYTTRNRWEGINGHLGDIQSSVDRISRFSSPGPTRDGKLKPDIAAPGAMIASCLSSHISQPNKNDLLSHRFKVNSGTSMACPFITGLCALLLQQNPLMNSAQIKSFLQTKMQIPTTSPGAPPNPNNIFLFGPLKF